jgi:EmrB/QacA subfamily drug resistance transporter
MSAPTGSAAAARLDRSLLAVASVVVLGAIMSILDTTVVNVALNPLARDFRTSLTTIQWIATGYTLALATIIPVSGWAADRYGTKRLYMLSIVLFVAGSALSGMAWSAETLILFRVLQGLGGGMLMPVGMTILTRAAGPQRVGRIMSIIGVPMLLGPIVGPIIGGWLVDDVSWRWIFFVNLPVGAIALAVSARVLAADEPTPGERFDVRGLALLSPSLALIIYGLAQSTAHGFASAQVLAPALAGVALLAAFVAHALRAHEPLIDLRLFANRAFASASVTLLLVVVAVFGALLLVPLYFQGVRGESALRSGLLLAPQGLGAMLVMPLAGRLTDRVGVGRVVIPGLVLVMASAFGLTGLSGDTSYWLIGALLFVLGLGIGLSMMPIFSGAMQTLRRASIARASTSLNIIQQVGASIGTAVMTVLLTSALSERVPGTAADGALGGTGQGLSARTRDLMGEAFGHTYWWALALLALALASALALPRRRPDAVEDGERRLVGEALLHAPRADPAAAEPSA